MRRRGFVLGTAAAVAFLRSSAAADRQVFEALHEGLREFGWVEGRNVAFEFRFAEGSLDRLPALAAELVRAKPDVIVTGSNPGALAAKQASSGIPIVMVTTGNPIAGGIIDSLARPGITVTGLRCGITVTVHLILRRTMLHGESMEREKN